jgi:hypothetical protein
MTTRRLAAFATGKPADGLRADGAPGLHDSLPAPCVAGQEGTSAIKKPHGSRQRKRQRHPPSNPCWSFKRRALNYRVQWAWAARADDPVQQGGGPASERRGSPRPAGSFGSGSGRTSGGTRSGVEEGFESGSAGLGFEFGWTPATRR